MANYIGNQPLQGEFKTLDSIESQFNGSSTSFALKYNTVSQTAGDASQLIVSLNGVIQQPLTSFTLSNGGSNIVFASPPAGGDTCFIVLLGGVGGTVTPTDNSVTTEKLVNSSVTSAKIVNNTITADDMDSSDSYAFAGVTVGSTFVTDTVNDRIGVGTTSPTYPLDVEDDGAGFIKGSFVSTGSAHSTITFDNTGSATASVRVGSNNDDFYVRTSGSEKLRVTSGGNVGIGTSSPAYKLQLVDTVDADLNIIAGKNSGDFASVVFGDTDYPAEGRITYQNFDDAMRFWANRNQAMIINSSGNVGIGETSPAYPLDINGGTENVVVRISSTDADALMVFEDNSTTDRVLLGAQGEDFLLRTDLGKFTFRVNNNATDGMVILNNGNVGIGTSSPSSALDVDVSQNSETNIELTNTNTGSAAQVRTKYTTDGGLFTVGKTSDAHPFGGDAYLYNVDNTNIRFATNDTERMRITSGGNLLVGTTVENVASSSTETGVRMGDGFLQIARSNNDILILNRQTSDGDIAVFRKDGVNVGKIDVDDGDNIGFLSTVSNHGGIICGTASIVPALSGTYSNGATDIGSNTSKWRDIHLSRNLQISGAVVFDGNSTGLDDYEEGTFTPVLEASGSNPSYAGSEGGRYTKVGNIVHFSAFVDTNPYTTDGSGDIYFAGLPFTVDSSNGGGTHAINVSIWGQTIGSGKNLVAQAVGSSDYLRFRIWGDNSNQSIWTYATASIASGDAIYVQGHYYTAS